MEEQKNTPAKEIDLVKVFMALWDNRKRFYIVLPITFVVAALIIVCVPRYYECQVTLVPETGGGASSSLGSLASSFGINIGSPSSGGDAIQPQLYPELLASSKFTTGMFGVEVETVDGAVKTTYYDYLLRHQKKAWWSAMFSVFSSGEVDTSLDNMNLFRLTELQNNVAQVIQRKISCAINKKTNVITISVQDQDPLVAATLADSVRVRLQKAITEYRTSKARIDLEFTDQLYEEAKADYEEVRQKYNAFSDANNDVMLRSVKSKLEDMEKDMNLKYTVYSNLALQQQQAQAKLQEKTPAFTELQGAAVPVKPAGPKRSIFVIAMVFVAGIVVSVYTLFKERKNIF